MIFQSRLIFGGERKSVCLPPIHCDCSGLIAAMTPPFVVVLPVKLAAGKVWLVWSAH
jgi:hypothetical protein